MFKSLDNPPVQTHFLDRRIDLSVCWCPSYRKCAQLLPLRPKAPAPGHVSCKAEETHSYKNVLFLENAGDRGGQERNEPPIKSTPTCALSNQGKDNSTDPKLALKSLGRYQCTGKKKKKKKKKASGKTPSPLRGGQRYKPGANAKIPISKF